MNYVRNTLGIIILACLLLSCSAAAAPFAYIANSGDDTVSVIDTATNLVTETVTVGGGPYGVAVSPDGSKVYVVSGSNSVSVIDTATNTVTATVTVGTRPYGVAVSPDGSKVYVANYGTGTVSVIDTATNTVTATVPVGTHPYGVAVSPDGSTVYLTMNNNAGTVSVIDTATNTVTKTVTVGSYPYGGVAVSPDGSKVYVANSGSNSVSVIDTATNLVTETVTVGGGPYGVAVSPDGSKVYVTDTAGTVSVINTATNTVTKTVTVGGQGRAVAVSPDGSKVYMPDYRFGKVSVIKTSDDSVTTVTVGTSPGGFGLFIIPPDSVTYNGNGNTGGSVPTDGSSAYAPGATVTVLGNTGSLTKTGATFSNWNTKADGTGISYAPAATFTITANTVLYAQWTTTVTYNGNGNTGGSVPTDGSSPYASGATVTVLGNTGSLVKTGYTFSNWNTAADGTGTSYAPAATFAIAANTVLYAQWKVSVTYNGNGNTGGTAPTDGSSPYASGATVTVLGNTGSLVKTGYTFSNWNTAADGTGTSYAPAATFTITANTVLYAQWKTTVTYNGNGNTGGAAPTDGSSPYASGATVTVLGNTGSLVKTGYTFSNWNTAADGTGTSYAPAATFAIAANTVLYAQWKVSVTYNGNGNTGGSVPTDGSSAYAPGATVTVLGNTGSLTKTGATFSNWNTKADGTGISYAPAATFTITANTVLYAQWTTTVTYNGNGNTGGSVPTDGSSPYASGATVTVLGNTGSLTKTGATFSNWNTKADGTGTSYAPAATFTITANTVLYAQWTTTVTYNGNGNTGGSVPTDGSSAYAPGATVTVLGNTGSLTKTGATFSNWNTKADGTGISYAPAATFTITANTVLYAQWTTTVTYNGNGNTGGSVPTDGSSPYASGATVTVLGNTGSLVKTGYTFSNWNTAADGTGTSYAPAATFAIAANTVLYAQWTAVTTTAPTPTPTATAVPVNPPSSDDSGPSAPANSVANTQGSSNTVSVNVGGNSPVTGVTVTGVGTKDLIVTSVEIPGPGTGIQAPPGIINTYVDITPARYTTITGAQISFVVPQSWLDEHHLTPQQIVLYHYDGTTWQALPTTFVNNQNGVNSFTAVSPGFSRYAITGQINLTTGSQNVTPSPTVLTIGELANISTTPTSAAPGPTPVNPPLAPVDTPQPTPGIFDGIVNWFDQLFGKK